MAASCTQDKRGNTEALKVLRSVLASSDGGHYVAIGCDHARPSPTDSPLALRRLNA